MQVTLTKVGISNQGKDGAMNIDKNGKTYYKAYIQTQEHGTRYINCNYVFESDVFTIQSWKPGMTVEVFIQDREWNGKTFTNFSIQPPQPPQEKNVPRGEFDDLKAKVTANYAAICDIKSKQPNGLGSYEPQPLQTPLTALGSEEAPPF